MKVILQEGIKDCGICSLLSIIRYYGGDVSKEYLRDITCTNKDGVSFYKLIEAAKMIGFNAEGLQGKIEDIDVNNLPCIAHFIVDKNYKHFVVVYDIDFKNKSIIIMDPAKGKRILSFSLFNLSSTGNYIFLKPNKKLPIIKNKNIIKKTIIKYLFNNKLIIIIFSLLIICSFIFNIISSFNFKYLLEYSINYNVSNNIFNISICLLFIYLFKNICSLLCNVLLNKWVLIFDKRITEITYKQIILLPYLYYKNRTTGEVVSRFKDLNNIKNYLSKFFCVFFIDFISIIIFFIIMFNYQNKLSIIILLFSIIFLFLFLFFIKRKKKITSFLLRKQDIVNSYLIESISNVDTMKGSHLEKKMYDTFNLKYNNMLTFVYKYNNLISLIELFKNLCFDLLVLIIYSYGTYLIIKNNVSLSNIIIYQSFFTYYINSFLKVLDVLNEFGDFKLSINRIEELFLISEEKFTNNYYYLSYNLIGDIKINNLYYKVGSRILFNNCNLIINKNEKILISGESGSGKSTLVKILMRYIEIPFGMVSINNIDINHYHLENIRNNICLVSCNEYLFTDTLKNNICLNKEIEEEEFNKICNICMVDDIIKNKDLGYNTLVEENGFNFSNGEKQRIILARSLVKNSNIYIFDEAFGNIDITREKKLFNNIFNYLDGKIIIVISHRFNNKKSFDKVFKINNGEINEI